MQQVLGNMTLPHSIGKVASELCLNEHITLELNIIVNLLKNIYVTFQTVKVAFFAEGADAEEARAAGADIVGGIELIEEIASKN